MRLRLPPYLLGSALTATVVVVSTCTHADRAGPGDFITALLLNPDSIALRAGDSVRFQAMGRTASGGVKPVEVSWSASGGSISAAGWYTAGHTAGSFAVIATAQDGMLADTSRVTISPPPPTLAQIVLRPDSVTLVSGASRQFTVFGRMTNGDSVAVSVTYAATGGSITAGGLYTAGPTVGAFLVVATQQGGAFADTARVTIAPPLPTLAQVVLLPDSLTLFPGATRQFAVYGRMTNGDSVAVGVDYTAGGGSIDSSGRYAAGPAPGEYLVIASQRGGTLADTSRLTISLPPTLAQVVLEPASVTLSPGATRLFAAYGRLSNGDSVALDVTYAVTEGGGSITAAGLYTAGPTVGAFAVIATEQGGALADTASVTIAAGPPTLSEVVLAPAAVDLAPGMSQQFTAYGWMTNGDSVAVSVTFSATGGAITPAGLYTAGPTPGAFVVSAVEQGGTLADTSKVTISLPPTLAQVVLVPDAVTLAPGATRQFAAYGVMTTGDSVPVDVVFSATGGTVTADGLYTAGPTVGAFTAIATAQGGVHADTASVTIAAGSPTLTEVVLVPAAVTLAPGDTRQFTAYGWMTNGDSVAVSVTFSATGGSITPAGLYSADATPGAFTVIATGQDSTLADTAFVTISLPPTIAQVVLVPAAVTLAPGASRLFAAYGLMTNGDSITLAVTYTATGGTITSTGLYMAGAATGSFAVIAAEQGGTLADTASVTIVSGPATLNEVVLVPAAVTLAPGDTQRFAAYGWMTNGDSVPVSVTFSAAGGTIDSGGLYLAGPSAGSFAVVATGQGGLLADTASVTINLPPTLARVVLVPLTVTLAPGAGRQFAAYGLMTTGDSVAVNATYTATGGTISPTGLYTAGPTVGTFAVIATAQGGALADTASVTIDAGPPTLTQVVLVPAAVTLTPGAAQQFTAYGWMTNGDSVAVTVTFAATGGTITSAGLYTASSTAGAFAVVATEQGGLLADTTSVKISLQPTLAQIALVPAAVTLVPGAARQFATYGLMTNGDSVPVDAVYSATGGSITTDGIYTAGPTVGAFAVIATERGGVLADTASVTISAGPATLTEVVLVPAAVTLASGSEQQFAAYGRMSNGDSVATAVTYSATGGTLTAGGRYTAGPATGSFAVIATDLGGTLADTAIVTISPPVLAQVVLVPASVAFTGGATWQFTAYGRLTNGDSVAPDVVYAATGGSVTATGLYTAGPVPGDYAVVATERGGVLTDTAHVVIVPTPTLAQVVLVPATAALELGGTRQFAAYGRRSNGDSLAVSVTYSATGGTITAAGLYTAGTTAGTFTVSAAEPGSGLADTATVTITAPALARVVVVPSAVWIAPKATQQFRAYGRLTNGDSVAVSMTYTATGGTISASGLYTADPRIGTYEVIARQAGGTLRDTAIVTITRSIPTLSKVVLVPSSATVEVGNTLQLAAYGTMSSGDSVEVGVTYSATGGTITTGGLYTAGQTPGVYRVIARQSGGPLADTSTVTVVPQPTLVQVVLTPSPVTLDLGASRQFAAYGVMSDGESVDITVTYAVTGGTITAGGLYTAGQATGMFQVIATVHGGALADTAQVTIATLAQVVLVPASATIPVGWVRQFTAYGRTTSGDSASVSAIYTATGGSITAGGLYTAGPDTGTFVVTATAVGRALADTATVRIVVSSGVVFVGAGDIADCSSSGDEATAALLDGIAGTVFTLGDNAYPDGSATDFSDCYDPGWGRHKARTLPAPGNHDYNTNNASGYFGYFGASAGPSGQGYYSYDLGAWHVISLNSEIPMSAGSPQETWLRADLAASTKQCTLAYWHKPRFSSGTNHGDTPETEPLWQALYDFGAELVLSGHEHNYERFAPQTPTGTPEPVRGIREFVVGTGGKSHYDGSNPIANSEVFNGTTWGVLQLTLEAGSYSWQFIPVPGGTFTDSGSGNCH
jgi:hypothetical protein